MQNVKGIWEINENTWKQAEIHDNRICSWISEYSHVCSCISHIPFTFVHVLYLIYVFLQLFAYFPGFSMFSDISQLIIISLLSVPRQESHSFRKKKRLRQRNTHTHKAYKSQERDFSRKKNAYIYIYIYISISLSLSLYICICISYIYIYIYIYIYRERERERYMYIHIHFRTSYSPRDGTTVWACLTGLSLWSPQGTWQLANPTSNHIYRLPPLLPSSKTAAI